MRIVCKDCKQEKEDSEFHKNKTNPTGFAKLCKSCKSDQHFQRKAKNPEKMRLNSKLSARKRKEKDPEKGKRYYAKNKERILQYKKDNREKDKDKINARCKLNLHILRGYIVRPDTCSTCQKQTDKIEAHHEDYTEALNVVWLCKECHIIADNEKKKRDDEAMYNLYKSLM